MRTDVEQRMEALSDPEHTHRKAPDFGNDRCPGFDLVNAADEGFLAHILLRQAAFAVRMAGMRL